jgi:hypothetical protein
MTGGEKERGLTDQGEGLGFAGLPERAGRLQEFLPPAFARHHQAGEDAVDQRPHNVRLQPPTLRVMTAGRSNCAAWWLVRGTSG